MNIVKNEILKNKKMVKYCNIQFIKFFEDKDEESEEDMLEHDGPEDEEMNETDLPSSQAEADIGIIEEITLVNFMCHKHLNIKFGPNINFIVGQNGSKYQRCIVYYTLIAKSKCSLIVLNLSGGKSAVLVALTIGLGAKAGFSNRGLRITDLIRRNSKYHSCSKRS